MLVVMDYLKEPMRKYYDFEDPLKTGNKDHENESSATIDQGIERNKY